MCRSGTAGTRRVCGSLLLILVLILVGGCSNQSDGEAEQQAGESATTSSSTASPAGGAVAGNADTTANADYVSCSMCGMKVLRSEAVFVDGKLLCAHCVPEAHGKGDSEQDASTEKKSASQ